MKQKKTREVVYLIIPSVEITKALLLLGPLYVEHQLRDSPTSSGYYLVFHHIW
jgi:hypothetical protein